MTLFKDILGRVPKSRKSLFSKENPFKQHFDGLGNTIACTSNPVDGNKSCGLDASVSEQNDQDQECTVRKKRKTRDSGLASGLDSPAPTEKLEKVSKKTKLQAKDCSVSSKQKSTELKNKAKAQIPAPSKRKVGEKKQKGPKVSRPDSEISELGEKPRKRQKQQDSTANSELEGKTTKEVTPWPSHVPEEDDSLLQPSVDDKKAQILRTPEEEAERLLRTVFVGNLPAGIKRGKVKSILSPCGQIESVRLRSVPIQLDKKLPRRAAILAKRISKDRGTAHAYVVFKDAGSVTEAIKLNMSEHEGLHIRVDKASNSDGKIRYDRSCSIFVGNLAFNVEDEDVLRFFEGDHAKNGSGTVKAVRVVRDAETNIGKGFGFVLFRDQQSALMALARDGNQLRGRPIRVTKVAVPGRGKAKPPKVIKTPQLTNADAFLRRIEGRKNEQLGSNKNQAPISSWQGLRTKGKDKVRKPAAATALSPAGSRGPARNLQSSRPDSKIKAKKRPAVLARKAKALGLPIPKAAKSKRRQKRAKN